MSESRLFDMVRLTLWVSLYYIAGNCTSPLTRALQLCGNLFSGDAPSWLTTLRSVRATLGQCSGVGNPTVADCLAGSYCSNTSLSVTGNPCNYGTRYANAAVDT